MIAEWGGKVRVAAARTLLARSRRTPEGLVALNRVRRLAALAGHHEGLLGRLDQTWDGGELADPAAARVLRGRTLGGYAMALPSLDLVLEAVRSEDVTVAVEFGSGASTLAVAAVLRDTGRRAARMISLEQDADEAQRVNRDLADLDLGGIASSIHVPALRDGAAGVGAAVGKLLDGASVDTVLIDGPAGPPGIRAATWPEVAPFCRHGATFHLDDGLRRGEAELASVWQRDPGTRVLGVAPVGTGVTVGVRVAP